MVSYLISFGVGLAVGGTYALISVRSPAPPLIALAGLLGMVLGEQAVGRMKGPTLALPNESQVQSALVANREDRSAGA